MRIGLIAPPWVPLPPPAYGEAVVDNLARRRAAALERCDIHRMARDHMRHYRRVLAEGIFRDGLTVVPAESDVA